LKSLIFEQSFKVGENIRRVDIVAGSFRQTGEPIAIKNAKGEHIKIGGFDAYYLDLIEL